MRSLHALFKVWLNTAWKETLSEINIMAFSDEKSLIQSFTQVRKGITVLHRKWKYSQ